MLLKSATGLASLIYVHETKEQSAQRCLPAAVLLTSLSAASLCSIHLGVSLYSSGQEAYSIACVPVDQRLHNVANVFSVAYELVDNWYRSIVGFVR